MRCHSWKVLFCQDASLRLFFKPDYKDQEDGNNKKTIQQRLSPVY